MSDPANQVAPGTGGAPAPGGFPRHLLTAPRDERLKYFESYMTAHPVLDEVRDELLRAIVDPPRPAFVFCVGPTGAGKSTLGLITESALHRRFDTLPEPRRLGAIPFVSVEVPGVDKATFTWNGFYRLYLNAMEEPLLDERRALYVDEQDVDEQVRLVLKGDKQIRLRSGFELRELVGKALRNRRPAAVLLDEAHHLTKVTGARRLTDQADCVKSMSSMGKTVHVLFGTYELLSLTELNGQVIRRKRTLHLRRYDAKRSQTDRDLFVSVLVAFGRHLPVAEPPDLVSHAEFLYSRSLGCVGVLKELLLRALGAALDEQGAAAGVILDRHLEEAALSPAECMKLLSELREGESRLEQQAGGNQEDLLRALELGPAPVAARPPAQNVPRRPPPGTRRPVRDTVQSHAAD